jgi:S1-C subfamily serine protease
MRQTFSYQFLISFILGAAGCVGIAFSQTPAPATTVGQEPAAATETTPRRPMKRVPTPPARVTVIPSDSKMAPQVVTIVHRLSGVKMLRLLRRQAGEAGVIETIDPETLMSDAHASIIAGWAMDDGKTIAARLPQAAAEIEVTEVSKLFPEDKARVAATTAFAFSRAPEPDLTVITNDGRKFRAHLVGLDAETGLSILQLNGVATIGSRKDATTTISKGEGILIFAPEPAAPDREATTRNTYVKIGKLDATVAEVTRSKTGEVEKLKVRSGKLSSQVIGGVACDQVGATIGMVESIDGGNATLDSADVIRAATRRVLDRRGSVPRPLLGISGEPVEQAAWEAFLTRGWRDEQVKDLVKSQVGILLTSVLPQTPAALAKLRPGDVIVRVNQTEVKDAEQFSKLLREAGTGERVEFTVMRPEAATPFSIPVTLGGSFAPFEMRLSLPRIPSPPFMGFQGFGLQTMALTREVALQMGARNGFLVLAVESDGAAGKAGIREGDVIESIDGRVLRGGAFVANPVFARQQKHTLTIVRNREKKQVVLETIE